MKSKLTVALLFLTLTACDPADTDPNRNKHTPSKRDTLFSLPPE